MITDYSSRAEVRAALDTLGFFSGFASPGRPELFVNPKTRARKTYARFADDDWRIMDYPEPSCCSTDEARELAKRDGITLQGGVLPPTALISATGVSIAPEDESFLDLI